MGRGAKNVISSDGRDRRDTGYYSTPDYIADFMTDMMLDINPEGKYVLDPAAGKEELLHRFHQAGKEIDSFDIHDHGNCSISNFQQRDFIDYYSSLKSNTSSDQNIDLKYDYYIANPPYNCHEIDYIRNNKKKLNGLFDDVGTRNMYSMFLSALIDCACENALIGIITLDSFLTAKMHEGLRNKILNHCSIHYLILCPADLFRDQQADVRTCILILQKGKENQGSVHTGNRPSDRNHLKTMLGNKDFLTVSIDEILLQGSIDCNEFIIGCPGKIKNLFEHPRIGEMFHCITGISTGNDAQYISKEKTPTHSVPFYKNPGTRRFYTTPDGYLPADFLEIDKQVKNFMVRNKMFLFKEGITCSSMGVSFGACYLPPNSTYGVNANIICEDSDIWWLLSYLNSSLVSYVVRSCLIRSNMITSGYVSRIPVPPFSEAVKKQLAGISKKAYEKKIDKDESSLFIKEIDRIIFDYLEIEDDIIGEIYDFTNNLLKAV